MPADQPVTAWLNVAGPLQEGDLPTLGGRGIARGEAAAVTRDAGDGEKVQGEPVGAVLVLPGPHGAAARTRNRRSPPCRGVMLRACTDGPVDEGGVVAPGAVQPLDNVIVCDPAATVNAEVAKLWYGGARRGEGADHETPSTRTRKSCREVPWLPRWAALKVSTYVPADQLVTVC